jgi:porin
VSDPDNPTRTKSGYWYVSYSVQQYLFQSKVDPSKGWGLFVRAAWSDGNPNPFKGHFFAGLAGNNLLWNRLDDRWGIGYFHYRYSDDLKGAFEAVNLFFEDEQGGEAFYNCAVTTWLRVGANVQIIDPAVKASSRSVYMGVSTQIRF